MRNEWLQTQFQDSLEVLLHKIFPGYKILSNRRKNIVYKGKNLEIDLWLPELSLCFEFQDFYHYKPAWYCQLPLNVVQQTDSVKRNFLVADQQTLIVIPCWWDGESGSLIATIHFARPELELKHLHLPISANPPTFFYEENMDFSHLMLASFPSSTEPNVMEKGSWWIGEKWDGIRCYWDTTDKQLYSQRKTVIELASLVGEQLESIALDAEIWCGRGFYTESQGIAFSYMTETDTSFVRLLWFDESSVDLQSKPFEKRYSFMLDNLPEGHPSVINAPRFLCDSDMVLHDTLQCITQEGGEGVMLRKPFSLYLPGRSESLFKMKASYTERDQEALVLKVGDDSSLLLQLANGFVFLVDKNNCMLPQHAVKNDIVSFKVDFHSAIGYRHFQNSGGHLSEPLANPIVYRIRSDITWEDVVNNRSVNIVTDTLQTSNTENIVTLNRPDKKEVLGWRTFFDKYAISQGMDPLNPVFWYGVTPHDIQQYDQAFKNYNGKFSTIIMQQYPEIGLQHDDFKINTRRLEMTQRAFFDKFAVSKGADPLNPVFWYGVSVRELNKFDKRYQAITCHYDGKLSTTLISLYPEIHLQLKKFKAIQPWNPIKRREFFDKFASFKGMDSLNPLFWYEVTTPELIRYDKSYSIASNYGKLSTILLQLYPDIGLVQSQFKVTQTWDENKRKLFFDKFACSKGGDPLNPDFWYKVKVHDLLLYNKGYSAIASYCGGKLSKILAKLYPDIGLQQTKFKEVRIWKNNKIRREYFDKFADWKGMDPLNPVFWYGVTRKKLLSFDKGYRGISLHYGGTLPFVLSQLYPDIGLQHHQFTETVLVP